MYRRLTLLALIATATPSLARTGFAQPAQGVPETTLHITETATITRAPDEVVATLRAEARAGTAAAAQDAVNRAIAAVVARARATAGVQVSTGAYWTGRVEDNRSWQATQTVTLRGQDAPALLDLAGVLQGQGLAMQSLHWRLTADTARAARDEASRLAIESLQRRAGMVAGQLGLALVGLREVRIDAPDQPDRPVVMATMRAASSSGAAPVSVAQDVAVSANVQAVAVLRPR